MAVGAREEASWSEGGSFQLSTMYYSKLGRQYSCRGIILVSLLVFCGHVAPVRASYSYATYHEGRECSSQSTLNLGEHRTALYVMKAGAAGCLSFMHSLWQVACLLLTRFTV